MTAATSYFAWQARLVLPEIGHRVLEYGCGLGNFTRHLLDRELVVACDTDTSLVNRIPHHDRLRLFPGGSNHPQFRDLADLRLDSCVCLNVMEHIPDDAAALSAIADILAPQATIVLLVPAFPALFGSIDRKLEHCRRYTRRSVTALADGCGLRIHKLHYMNLVGFFGWWLNNRVLHKEEQSPAQIAVFDRLIVPVMSRLESIIPPPFGQSLFVVLKKC